MAFSVDAEPNIDCAKGHIRPYRAFAVYTTHSLRCFICTKGDQCLLEASYKNINNSKKKNFDIRSFKTSRNDSNCAKNKSQAGFWYNQTPKNRIASNCISQNPTQSKTEISIGIMGMQNHYYYSFKFGYFNIFLFFSLIFNCCQADILPFDLNNSDKPSQHFPTPNNNNNYDNFYFPTDIVVFHRWIRATSSPLNEFRIIENFRRDEHFVIDEIFNSTYSIQFECKAYLNSYFSDNNETIILPVSWVTDDGTIMSATELLEVQKSNKELKIRCKADLRNLDVIIDGSLLSRSIYFSHKPYNSVKIQPEIIHTNPKNVARFLCHWPPWDSPSAIWKHNDQILNTSKNIKIESIPGKSVLHILSTSLEQSGDYHCIPTNSSELQSEISTLIIDDNFVMAPFSNGIHIPKASSVALGEDHIFECLLPGIQGVRWILERRPNKRKNETLPRIDSKVLGNGSILVLKNITQKFNGNIKCIIEVENNTLITKETEFKVLGKPNSINYCRIIAQQLSPTPSPVHFPYKKICKDYVDHNISDPSFFNYEPSSFTEITRKQGTPMTFRCETYDILGETPEMAVWYLNGKPIKRTPNVKVTRSMEHGIGSVDLIIAIAESDNEGIYTCIISNNEHERIRELLFEVEITTKETIKDLKVTTNHEKSCIRLDFDLPKSADLSFANFAPFFVVVHENNSNESLNSLPVMGKCNFRLHCKLDICQASGMLEDATEYMFRISMVISGSGTIITPLSKPTIATTWDSLAKRSLPLHISYNATENSITVTWDIPTNVKGQVEKFVIQVVDYTENMSNLLGPVERGYGYYERPLNQRIYQIFNATDAFVYKFRVTPITRKGDLPKLAMPNIEFFPFIIFSSEQTSIEIVPDIPIPVFSLKQFNHDPIVNISWKLPNETSFKDNKILIKYQSVVNTQSKFLSIERPIIDGSTNLTKGIEVGFVYQICATFFQKVNNIQSAWACQTIPVKTNANTLIFTTYKEASNRLLLPPAVICESDNCRCKSSKINEGGMRIEWNEPQPRGKEGEPKPIINYIVHYTFNETDASSKEYELPANDGDLFVELPPILPNTSYRIMIESRNQIKDSVDGTFFTCLTPPTSPLPPPKNFQYTFINATHVKLSWIPFPQGEQAAKISGYTIFWQPDNKPFLPIFIPGAQSSFYIIGGLEPKPLYQAYIVSRSQTFENSPAKSPSLFIRLPPAMSAAFDDLMEASTHPPSFYRDPDVLQTFIIVTIALSCILLILLGIALIYFCCCMPLWRWKKQQRREALQRAHSNASSALTLQNDDDIEVPPMAIAVEVPLLRIPSDPPNMTENLCSHDTKGPAGGPRPLGNRKFHKMMHDEDFREKMIQLNRDPTGLGLPPGTRDECYQHLQCDEDRRFHEIVEKEKHDIQKRRRTGKKKMKQPTKFQNIAETSFMEHTRLTPNPSLHDDAYSDDGSSRKYPASTSMTELNQPSEGLSPRSYSVAIYRRFFPRKRPTIMSGAKKALMETPPPSHHHHHRITGNNLKTDNFKYPPPASSLPNLADSGIVYDEHHSSNAAVANNSIIFQILPTIHQASRSGSVSLVEDVISPNKKSHSIFNHRLQDCRQSHSVLESNNSSPATLVP